jgi:hypothetical protein
VTDPVLRSFLRGAAEDSSWINRHSETLRLVADPRSGDTPRAYHALLRGVEHLRREPGGAVEVSSEPIPFTIVFPEGYLTSADPGLQLKLVHLGAPIFAVNVRPPLVCLGSAFQPGTRLRSLVEHVYAVLSSRVFDTADAFSIEARDYYYRHAEQVRGLRAAPLWVSPVAASAHVEPMSPELLAQAPGRAGS